MKNFLKLSISALTAALLLAGCASDSSAPAASAMPAMTDTEVANKFKGGEWVGQWSIAQYNGKFVLIVTAVDGNKVTGEGHFYGTANGDVKEALSNAVVNKGQLTATLPKSTMKIAVKLRDEKSLRGSWEAGGYTGDLTGTRK